MFFNIIATFAEFEVDLLRMRTREGMAIARANGRLKRQAAETQRLPAIAFAHSPREGIAHDPWKSPNSSPSAAPRSIERSLARITIPPQPCSNQRCLDAPPRGLGRSCYGRAVPEVLELTKAFAAQTYGRAFESWSWIDLMGKAPLFTSLFGDVVLEDASLWFLSMLDGTLQRVWSDRAALRASLASEEGQDTYLLAGLALGAHARGLVLGSDQVFNFVPAPILGGPVDVDHLVPTDFAVAVNIMGQLHGQLKDLPRGAKISGLTIGDSSAHLGGRSGPGRPDGDYLR